LKFSFLVYKYSSLQAPEDAKALVRVGSGPAVERYQRELACIISLPAYTPTSTYFLSHA